MIQGDLLYVLQWWLLLFVSGLSVLPLAALIFPSFLDRGYAFAKILGIILISYFVFVLGTIRLTPFTPLTIYAVTVSVACISVILSAQTKALKHLEFKKRWKIWVFEELFFLGALIAWSYVRAFNPDIYGLEKYMDFGFVNSIIRSVYFPPRDMWFTPYSINYYYFGHLVTAVLTKASHIPSFITFNLMMATIFSLCFTQVFSLSATLWRHAFPKNDQDATQQTKRFPGLKSIVSTGILASALVTLAGNLHILYAFFSPYENDKPVPLWDLKFLPEAFHNSYWYPNATRFIYNTIHEFPIYSWVVSDLHGHVLDIPIVLFTVALIYSFFVRVRHHELSEKAQIIYSVGIGFFLAIMYMTNAWDGLIYLMLTGLILVSLEWQRVRHHKKNNLMLQILPLKHTHESKIKKLFTRFWLIDLLVGIIAYLVIIGVSYLIFALPFSSFFSPSAIVKGIGVLCVPQFLIDKGNFGPFLFEADHCQKSPWWQLLMLYGFFYFFIIMFVLFLRKRKTITDTDAFMTVLIVLATILIVIPEFFYMKDIYPAHYRANTMFKLVFQAFMLLSIASGYIIMRTITALRQKIKDNIGYIFVFIGYGLFVTFLTSLVFTYPVLAIKSYYGDVFTRKDSLGNEIKPKGLDGMLYLKNRYPSDYEAIVWLNKKVKGQPVILEAQGDSYTDHARVSANTGLPTVLGWTVHEWLWRGSYDIPSPRIAEIQTIYETESATEAENLLKTHKVEYIFVGDVERTKYPSLKEEKFAQLGKKVFEHGSTRIYKYNLK